MRMDPRTLSASRTAMTKIEDREQRSGLLEIAEATSVAGLSTTMPAFFRAMMPRNRPIPVRDRAAQRMRYACNQPASTP